MIIVCLITLHTYLTFNLSVPGCPDGYLGPGGLHAHSQHINCTGGATGYIDRYVFGDNHIYQSPTSKHVYHSTMPFDPEGKIKTQFLLFYQNMVQPLNVNLNKKYLSPSRRK